jgi:hypothetical protein
MTRRRDWIKVRKDWWESPSHRLISPGARFFGVFLLYLADSDPEWRETGIGRIVGPTGVALGSEDVARLAGVRSRDGRRWVQELIDCGTLHIDDTGCMFFPNYREHQENRSARSMRRARKSVHSEHACEQDVNGEEEEEAEEEADLNPPTPRKRGSATSTMASVEDTKRVCAWIASARQRAGIGKARPPAVTEQTRREVKKPMDKCGATLADWRTVIDRQVAACRGDIDAARKYLTLSTLHRPGNFTRLLERDDLDGVSSHLSILPEEFR